MKGRLIALDHMGELEAAALMVDGRLEDILFDSESPRPGTIYRAIVDRPLKGQGGVILKTPDGSAFLKQAKGLAPGQSLLVQVTGFADDGKAIPVTSKVLFKSRYAIVTPDAPGRNISRSIKDDELRDVLAEVAHDAMSRSDMGLILRSCCADANPDEIADDITAMRELAEQVLADATGTNCEVLVDGDGPHAIAWREWSEAARVDTASGSFEANGVLDELDLLASAKVNLSDGASMYVEPTRALVAVDVNTGGDSSPAAGLKANMAVARELPRQLRLRGLGGQITIDPAPMPVKDRRAFESALRGSLKKDTVDTVLVGWTPLGHFELQRKRERQPISQVLK